MNPLVLAWTGGLVILVAVMSLAWAVQRRTRQGGWVDAFWSFGVGLAGVWAALAPGGPTAARGWLAAGMIAAWSLRLARHLARRAASGPNDARYARLEAEWGASAALRMFVFLMLQAIAGSVLVAGLAVAARRPGPLGAQDLAALAILTTAVAGEGLADRQLRLFKGDPANKDRICDRGLWGWSRHPNYLFEWLGWCAWPVMAIARGWPWGWIALSAPAYMYWLLRHVSGVPLLEEHMRRTRPEAFVDYARRTPVFFPFGWRAASGR